MRILPRTPSTLVLVDLVFRLADIVLRAFARRDKPEGGASDLPEDAPEVRAAREVDAADDSAAADAARAAREDAEIEAASGWTSERTRKLPGGSGVGPLILALSLGAWASLSPSPGACQETAPAGPLRPEVGATVPDVAPAGCARLDGPFPAVSADRPAVGFWVENGKGYVCTCPTGPADFGDVTMVPGGCKLPDALPLIALRPEGWTFLAGRVAQSASVIESLRAEVGSARDQRDVALQETRGVGTENERLARERDAARESLMSGIGAGALAGGAVVALIAFFAVN